MTPAFHELDTVPEDRRGADDLQVGGLLPREGRPERTAQAAGPPRPLRVVAPVAEVLRPAPINRSSPTSSRPLFCRIIVFRCFELSFRVFSVRPS